MFPPDVRIRRVAPRSGRVPRIRIAAEVDGERQTGHGEVLVLVGVSVRLLRVPTLARASGRCPRNCSTVLRPGLGRSTTCHTITISDPSHKMLGHISSELFFVIHCTSTHAVKSSTVNPHHVKIQESCCHKEGNPCHVTSPSSLCER